MKRDGVALDSSTFKSILDAFVKLGKFDSALEILDHVEKVLDMGTNGTSLKPDVNNSILVALVRNNKLSIALTMFVKLLDSSNNGIQFAPTAIACNELLVGLRKADMRVEFKNVFEKLRVERCFPLDVWGYNICIHAFGSWGELATCLSLFKEMKEKSVSLGGMFNPDLCTYNSLIQVLCFVGKVKDALAVWEDLKGSGHEPDAFSYRIIIQGCCKSYWMNDASKIFSEMQYNGFQPNIVVYNSVLDGFLKARKLTEACQLFEKMVDDGVRASCWTYNILIDGLFKNGRPQAAYVLFNDLKKKGHFVDGITYSIVISHICRAGLLEEALKLMEEMEARAFPVDLVTITSFLVAAYKQGRWDLTDKLMKYIRDGNLMPNVLKWKANMDALMKNPQSREKDFSPMFPAKGDFTEILSLISSDDISDMENLKHDTDQWSSSPYMDFLANQVKSSKLLFKMSRGKRVQDRGMDSFDNDMVNTYLSIFLAKGKLSLACKLFEIFTNLGVNPVSYTYNSMMSSFVKKGYMDEAYGVLHEMGDNFCSADIATYNVMIQGLGNIGRADLACAVLDTLMKEGCYLDIVMYNTLINALGKAGRFNEADKLFQQMRKGGLNPDVVTYNILIEVHAKAGQLKEAYKFLKMMLDAGCVPNHVTDTILDFLDKQITQLKYQKALKNCAN